ncbi:glycosyltransferase family 4 protein [Pandoraea sp. SD6-2]|uniref:glycosyltransferase family 4 protein n=1 Tax=Pandoraea sp. SD6-2 TaxID=1286093 RepID=UPI00032F004A|nr:glycosyltransferase family 4 protein [Pandoraea sp. SD6-2]EON11769.1 glycosyltransferase [Pandoraea sp. SD6-2]
MRVLIVSQYFWPENFRINDLASGLRERGHDVEVLTGRPNYPAGKLFKGYGWFKPWRETYDGIPVFRVPIVPRFEGRGRHLAMNYLSFVVSGCLLAPWFCRGKYDVIFVYGTSPITVALPAMMLRALKRAPMQLQILDLWPETLEAIGVTRSRWAARLADGLVRFIYRHCDQVLVQSRGFVESVVSRGVPAERVDYFPTTAESLFSASNGDAAGPPVTVPGEFKVMFAGNVGDAQDFGTILDAAALTAHEPRITWAIVGDGRRSAWVASEVSRRGLSNVALLGRHPLDTMPAFFAQADALLVTLKRDPVFALTIPGKLQSYLSFGKPVVAALDGEGARLVKESGAGLVCDAGDAEGLARSVLSLAAMNETQRAELGQNGRRYFGTHFERNMLLDRLCGWMHALAQGGRKASTENERI